MSDLPTQQHIAALVSPRIMARVTAVVAAGANDNAPIIGLAIDRIALKLPRTVVLAAAFTTTLAAAATLALKNARIEHSDDGATNWTTFLGFADPGIVATGPVGGGTLDGQCVLSAQLSGARQFIRFVVTPDLSAAGADIASVTTVGTFAGFDRLPSP